MNEYQKISNWPKPLSIRDYELCVEAIKKEASANSTVRSVYLMGADWCPGISDLDIVVVYKDSVSPQYMKSPWSLGDTAAYIFTHRYLGFGESTARFFYFLYPEKTSRLRLIAGEPISFLQPNGLEEEIWTSACILFDVLVNKLLLFERFNRRWNQTTNVRNLIGELYSLTYTISMVKTITGEDVGEGFDACIGQFKESWFAVSLGREEKLGRLFSLLEDGGGVVARTVEALDRFLIARLTRSRPAKTVQTETSGIFSNNKYQIIFINNWSRDKFTKEFKKSKIGSLWLLRKKMELFRIALPASFVFFFTMYAKGEGEFSKKIRRHFSMSRVSKESFEIPIGVRRHVEAMNFAFKDSLATSGNFKIPFSFGFSFQKRGLWRNFFLSCVLFVWPIKK